MAEDEQGATVGHNAAARRQIILDVCTELASLEAERSRIGKDIAEVKQKRVKGDLGMKIADFNFAYRLYKLEQEDRDTMLDTIRETFAALGIGEQGSLFPDTGDGGSAGADGDDVRPRFMRDRTEEKTQEQIAAEMDPETGTAPEPDPAERRPRNRRQATTDGVVGHA